MEERWALIGRIWRDNRRLYFVPGFLLGLLFFPVVEILLRDVQQYIPEIIGIIVTVGIIDARIRRQERKREERELETRLVREAGIPNDHGRTMNALREAQQREKLRGENSIFTRKTFDGVDWRRAKLVFANLEGSLFMNADLRKIQLPHANLRDASFEHVTMTNSNLMSSDMTNVLFEDVTLKGCDLSYAIFAPRDVIDLTLPDGSGWTPEIDMRRFTDPEHPDFWGLDT